MNIIAYVISILAFIFSISSSFIKGHTKIQMGVILTFTFLSNFFAGLGYIINGTGINGTVSCMLGAIISVINFFYRMKNKPVPIVLLAVYTLAFTVLNIVFGEKVILTVLSILATFAFILCVAKQYGKEFRNWKMVNNAIWSIYDITSKSYNSLLIHVATFLFTLLGSAIYDIKKEKSK